MGALVCHRTFVIERDLPGSARHAFRFWAEFDLKRRWTSCHPDWTVLEDSLDFNVPGSEVTRWRMPDGTEHGFVAHYMEIVPAERIIYAFRMDAEGRPVSSSLATVELVPSGAATRMTYTEQAAFADPAIADMRESGTGSGFDRLVELLERAR
jgi:uncharacterized protein YndB with AHSA1/START domain